MTDKINYELFKKLNYEMFKMQEQLNNKQAGKDWKNRLTLTDFECAIIAEAGEALESWGYKWWKKQIIDMENVQTELIDILHFLLSQYLLVNTKTFDSAIDFIYKNYDNMKEIENLDYKEILAVFISCRDMNLRLYYLYILFYKAHLDIEQIYKRYMTKNVLNQFRNANGYKEGTYQKIWNNEEDNVVAIRLASKIDDLDHFKNKLYQKLETYYNKIIPKALF